MTDIVKLIDLIEAEYFRCPAGPLVNFKPWVKLREGLEVDARDSLYTVEDGWAEIFTGTRFFYKEPTLDMIHFEDVANSLGKMCRYGGHTHTFYSVAEHSCLMLLHAVEQLKIKDKRLLRTIVMHDATEAYLPDLPRPLKHMLPQFKAFETMLEEVIAERFGLIFPHPPIVKELDSRILCDERAQAMNPSYNDWGIDILEPLGVELQFYTPSQAIEHFYYAAEFLEIE